MTAHAACIVEYFTDQFCFLAALESRFLLYTNAKLGEIQGISLDAASQDHQVIEPISNLQRPVAVDYDRESQYVYYSDAVSLKIGRRKLIDPTDRNDDFITEGRVAVQH